MSEVFFVSFWHNGIMRRVERFQKHDLVILFIFRMYATRWEILRMEKKFERYTASMLLIISSSKLFLIHSCTLFKKFILWISLTFSWLLQRIQLHLFPACLFQNKVTDFEEQHKNSRKAEREVRATVRYLDSIKLFLFSKLPNRHWIQVMRLQLMQNSLSVTHVK